MIRRAGILLHPTSLPGDGPCGDLGDGALRFLDWLAAAGCTLWQVLPLNPPGAGLSPYDSPGVFAGNTGLLSLQRLVDDGLLSPAEIAEPPAPLLVDGQRQVDVVGLHDWHAPRVARAAHRLAQHDAAALAAFTQAEPWVADWALFRALCADRDVGGWWELPPPLREREPAALDEARDRLASAVGSEIAAQLLFRRQWSAVRAAAHERGVHILGDVPIFVGGNGYDTWAHRDLFRWARRRGPHDSWRPSPVAGVPPDYFSPTGQAWGNPMYDWAEHRRTGFAWWTARLRAALALCDVVRVDHFRGFAGAWAIPAPDPGDDADATTGRWERGPGAAPFMALARTGVAGFDELPLPLLAEDLGHITPDVVALREKLGVPGMKVLQFAFGGDADHPFLPHNYEGANWAVYSGTHDNDTALGWYGTTDHASADRFRVYVGRDGTEAGWDLIRLAWASTARWAVAPLQDVLGLDARARMNTPGLGDGNWRWRASELPGHRAERLRSWAWAYGRLPSSGPTPDKTL